MSCVKYGLLLLVATIGLLVSGQSASAALLSHFTFDSDASNAVSPTLDGTFFNGAAIDNSTAVVGGGSVYFDGVDDYVDAGSNAVPGIGGAMYTGSIALWIKTDISAGPANIDGAKIIGMQNGDPATFGADDRMAFLLESSSAGNMRNFVRADDSAGSTNNRIRFTDDETGTTWADGSWGQYVFSWSVDASANLTSAIYFNGSPVAVSNNETGLESDPALSPLNPWESPAGMFIGAFNNRVNQGGSASVNFNGWIDDLRIYDEVLTSQQVADLYALGIPEPSTMVLGAFTVLGLLVGRCQRGVC